MPCGAIYKPYESVPNWLSGLLRAVALGAVLALCSVGAIRAEPLSAAGRAGFGSARLPGEAGEPLGGYGGLISRNAAGELDAPYARALVVEQGGRRAAIVVLDIVISRPELRSGLDAWAKANAVDLLSVVASHTHSGPGGYLEGWLAERLTGGRTVEGRSADLIEAARKALDRALGDRRGVSVATARVPIDLAVNRRDPDGAAANKIRLLRLSHPNGDIVMVSYPMHPTVLPPRSKLYSADYPAVVDRELKAQGLRTLYLPAGLGDQAPPDRLRGESRAEHLDRVGEALALATLESQQALRFEPLRSVRVRESVFALPPLKARRFCALWWLRPFASGSLSRFLSESVPIQILELNQIRLALLPLEPSLALAQEVRATWPAGEPTFVVSHANDWTGYALTPDEYDGGGYEACLSFHGRDLANWLQDATRQLKDPQEP